LNTEIIPLLLRIMEHGSELSKTVATFILQKILLDDHGLAYICYTYERFKSVTSVLQSMVDSLVREPSGRLLKHVVRCYLRLTDNPRAKEALNRTLMPDQLKDGSINKMIKQDDNSTKRWVQMLQRNLSNSKNTPQQF